MINETRPPFDEDNPLGPERNQPPAGEPQSPRLTRVPAQTPPASDLGSSRSGSRFDAEVERLRRSPTPTLEHP